MTVRFNATKEETCHAHKAVDRYMRRIGAKASARIGFVMDVIACHANGCPLDLAALAEADNLNLVHDIGGIHINLDRGTGKLQNCFWPRYAKKAA